MSLIRPGAISEEIIVPCFPFGSLTNVIVFVTFSTVHNVRSPSFMLIYRTSSTRDRIFAFPPAGTANTVLHSRHLTFVEAFPKIV